MYSNGALTPISAYTDFITHNSCSTLDHELPIPLLVFYPPPYLFLSVTLLLGIVIDVQINIQHGLHTHRPPDRKVGP